MIFISYSRNQTEFAMKLAAKLEEAGAAIWVDQFKLEAGNPFDDSIEQAITSASAIIVVLSKSAVASTWVKDEIAFAIEVKKTIIPVLFEECKIPFRLGRHHYANFVTSYEYGFNELCRSLATLGVINHADNFPVKIEAGNTTTVLREKGLSADDPLIKSFLHTSAKKQGLFDARLANYKNVRDFNNWFNTMQIGRYLLYLKPDNHAIQSEVDKAREQLSKRLTAPPPNYKKLEWGLGIIGVIIFIAICIKMNLHRDGVRIAYWIFYIAGVGSYTLIISQVKANRKKKREHFVLLNQADLTYASIKEAYQLSNWFKFRRELGLFANTYSSPTSSYYIDLVTSERFAESLRLAAEAGQIEKLKDDEKLNSLKRLENAKGYRLPESLFMLGYLHENGLFGLSKNDIEAKRYYEEAIENGSEPALFHLGMMHKHGSNFITKNNKIANQLLKLSCDNGYRAACKVLMDEISNEVH